MAYTNLPQIVSNKLDGNLAVVPTNNNPIVVVVGTAASGDTESLYRVDSISDAVSAFGKSGTLVRGMYEVAIAGATNIRLMRIGATSATLSAVGSGGTAAGYTIETVSKDASAGTDYKIYYDDSTTRLRIYRASDDVLVYDNYPAYPPSAVDLNEVSVSGTASTGDGDIGTLTTPITLAAADGVSGASYTAGTDGLNLSRMQIYEALYEAYRLLEDQQLDLVVPMNVFLDDLNVMDMTATNVSDRSLAAVSSYPTAGTTSDVLGKAYVEEYQGKNYWWWWFPENPGVTTFDAANIFPSAGDASATLKTDGTALADADFHEVNFAYQLAEFCRYQGEVNVDMVGFIGTLPPNSFSLKDISSWIGTATVTGEDGNNNTVVTTNGTGLLGNKFMAGKTSFTINGISGLAYGGFIKTDDGWLDGAHETDANDALIDIGKYISVVASYVVLSNPSQTAAYVATYAPSYAGLCSTLPPNIAPTRQVASSVSLPYRINARKLDLLAGLRYITVHARTSGIVVSDAPTAARPDSDYRRYSTMAQVKDCVDAVREAAEPFLGKGMTGTMMAAMETAIEARLTSKVKAGVISKFTHQLISTAQQKVLGQATLQLKLVPAFELRQLTVVVALAAE